MKKKSLILFLIYSVLSLTIPCRLFAASSPTLNLSDAIIADLAIKGELDNVSLVYTSGKTVDDVKLNETKHWLPASTVKTFAAMYAYKLIAEGNIHPTDSITIDAKNEVPTELVTDELPTLMIGDSVSVERLLRQMITQSDNTAFNQLLDLLGRDNITTYVQSLGLTHTHIGSKLNLDDSQTQYEYDVPGYGINTTTAEDYAQAFLLIKNNKIPGAKDLFSVLTQQKIRYIAQYLPPSVTCGTKTGDLDPLYHDGGICEDGKKSYVLSIFTNGGNPDIISHLSQIIYTRNYDLVGKNDDKPTIGNNIPDNPPIDPLVMTQPKTAVLGASTTNFPVPEITATDLGVKASDLSLVLSDKQLPNAFIPADSPLHPLSDAWQMVKILTAPNQQARQAVNFETAKLRLAEAKDLVKRGKVSEAQTVLTAVQHGLTITSSQASLQTDPTAQNIIQAVSQTRFAILGNALQQTKGQERLQTIQAIANQAKQTIQTVQPHIPEAMNATNLSQKPLIGTVVSSTPTSVTILTAGGQQITVPTANTAIKPQGNQNTSPIPTQTITSAISPAATNETPGLSTSPSLTITPTPFAPSVAVGSTIAVIGSTVNNKFAPSLILTNVPKELVAPEPVTVAKVDTKHNTMVVIENGVYTQVNINKDTTIKGADTNIPLTSVQAGDVVVVHGQPLTPAQIITPHPSIQPTTTSTPNSSITPSSSPTIQEANTKAGNPAPALTSVPQTTSSPTGVVTTTTPKAPTPIKSTTLVPQITGKITTSPTITQRGVTSIPTAATVKTTPPTTQSVTTTPPVQTQPKVIESTSIQVIEKKTNIPSTPAPTQTTSAPVSQPQPQTQSQPKPQNQPQPQQPAAQTSQTTTIDTSKKK